MEMQKGDFSGEKTLEKRFGYFGMVSLIRTAPYFHQLCEINRLRKVFDCVVRGNLAIPEQLGQDDGQCNPGCPKQEVFLPEKGFDSGLLNHRKALHPNSGDCQKNRKHHSYIFCQNKNDQNRGNMHRKQRILWPGIEQGKSAACRNGHKGIDIDGCQIIGKENGWRQADNHEQKPAR